MAWICFVAPPPQKNLAIWTSMTRTHFGILTWNLALHSVLLLVYYRGALYFESKPYALPTRQSNLPWTIPSCSSPKNISGHLTFFLLPVSFSTACHQHRLQCPTRHESRCHCSLFVSSHGSVAWWKEEKTGKFSLSPLSLCRATASMYLTMYQAKPKPTCSVGSPRVLPFVSTLTCSLPYCTLPSFPCLSSKSHVLLISRPFAIVLLILLRSGLFVHFLVFFLYHLNYEIFIIWIYVFGKCLPCNGCNHK